MPPGRSGVVFEAQGPYRGELRSPSGVTFRLDIDPGEERSELRPVGGPLLPRGPEDLPDCALLDFALETGAAACLGPLAALSSGRYLLIRCDHRPRLGPACWGNTWAEAPGHHRGLYAPPERSPARPQRVSDRGQRRGAAPPVPTSSIRTAIVGAQPGSPPGFRQPLIGLVVEDFSVVAGADGVFLVPLAESEERPGPPEDLLVVLPLEAPLFVSALGGALGAAQRPDWEGRIRRLGDALAAPGRGA